MTEGKDPQDLEESLPEYPLIEADSQDFKIHQGILGSRGRIKMILALSKEGMLTREDFKNICHLSGNSVSKYLKEFLEEGIIEVTYIQRSRYGKAVDRYYRLNLQNERATKIIFLAKKLNRPPRPPGEWQEADYDTS